jgi:GNAT superfamily N-acetyltransferase
MIILRPARPEDKQAVDSLASQIWDGDDYVADCFDDWVADPHGRFTVAYSGQTLVGIGKLTRLTPNEWWLEGLRVDPAWRGRGIARLLHEEAVRTADQIAQGMLRFATNSRNTAVHKIALDSGFQAVSDHLLVELPLSAGSGLPASTGRLIPVAPEEEETLKGWLAGSDHFAACGGLMEDGWQWFELLPQLAALIERGKVFWWASDATTAHSGLVIFDQSNEAGKLHLNYVDVPLEDWPRLTHLLRNLADRSSARILKGKPLARLGLESALADAGWVIEEDTAMRVFGREIKNKVEIKE